jgi:hypothetical protein
MPLSIQVGVGLFFAIYFCLLFSFCVAMALTPFWDIPDQWSARRFKIWWGITFVLSEGFACTAASGHGVFALLTAAITVIALTTFITRKLIDSLE